MKIRVLITVVTVSFALATPAAAEAVAKKPRQAAKPAPVVAVQPSPPPEAAVPAGPDPHEIHFAGEVVGTVPEAFRESVEQRVSAWLDGAPA